MTKHKTPDSSSRVNPVTGKDDRITPDDGGIAYPTSGGNDGGVVIDHGNSSGGHLESFEIDSGSGLCGDF